MPSSRFVGAALALTGTAIGALIPVFLVLYPAAGLTPDKAKDPAALLATVTGSPWLVVGPGILQMAGHALGAVGMIGLWWRFGRGSYMLTAATLGGVVWMSVDLILNAVTLQVVPGLAASHAAGDPSAATTLRIVMAMTDALRLGGHAAGGLWVIGSAIALAHAGVLNRSLAALGVATGAVLSLNVVLPALLNASFMTVPLWLVILGVAVGRAATRAVAPAAPAVAPARP